jgi:HAD superfamily hydrolase (TIGR01509 family)
MAQLKAVIFGAIGTIAETSDIQRQAFNAAFQEAGLDWYWNAETYRDLLKTNGGQNRIRAYRDTVGGAANLENPPVLIEMTDAMVANLHQSKTEHYVTMLENTPLRPRPGVTDLIAACRQRDIPVALCTSTATDNVKGLGAALSGLLAFDQFATIVTIDQIAIPKPAPDAYMYCLQQLGLTADQVIAIEDTPVSISAAKAAGITTIAMPGETTSDQDFFAADLVVNDLTGMTVENLSSLLIEQWHVATYFSQ